MRIFIFGGSGYIGSSLVKLLQEDNKNKIAFTYCTSKEKSLQMENENTKSIEVSRLSNNSIEDAFNKAKEDLSGVDAYVLAARSCSSSKKLDFELGVYSLNKLAELVTPELEMEGSPSKNFVVLGSLS